MARRRVVGTRGGYNSLRVWLGFKDTEDKDVRKRRGDPDLIG